MGRLQVLVGTHFPGMLARFGGLMIPLLSDRGRPKTPTDNIDGPEQDGRERSRHETGRPVSAYSIARRIKPAATVAAAVGGMVGIVLLTRRMWGVRPAAAEE